MVLLTIAFKAKPCEYIKSASSFFTTAIYVTLFNYYLSGQQ